MEDLMAAKMAPIDINALMDDPGFASTAQKYANLDPVYKAVLSRITPNSDYFNKQLTLLKMADEKQLGESKNALIQQMIDEKTTYDVGLTNIAAENLATKENSGYTPQWYAGSTAKDLLGLGSVIAAAYGAKTKLDVADKLTDAGYGLQAYQKLYS